MNFIPDSNRASMELIKTPSVQSLMDSDLESVESLQYLDIEELDDVEYALPTRESPTLAEVLIAAEDEDTEIKKFKNNEEPTACSVLQVDFLQAVSQQLTHAQERSSAGSATTLSVGVGGKLSVGTAHGHILSFHEQTLRWVCDSNADRGAVSCLSYGEDGSRLLAGYACGIICQYDSVQGVVLRRVTLGGELWGTLQVTWAGSSGLALDTGGSVWLIKFSRPLGVRSARTSCLFSGARGEVVAMAARDARILALATLSRVIIVAGGRAAGVRMVGPPDTLPVLAWCENDDRTLVCARAGKLQWLSINVTGTSISLQPTQRIELKVNPLWLGWLGGSLVIFDADENIRMWGDDYDKPLDLSHIEPVYASAFFKGVWTDGRVSRAMYSAGVNALGGVCVCEGSLSLLGRRGIVRVRPRDLLARAQAFLNLGRYLQALQLLCSTQGPEACVLAKKIVLFLSERPHILNDKQTADQTIKLCLKYNLSDELWSCLWEQCATEKPFAEAIGEAAVRGELSIAPPTPDCTQVLIEKLAEFEPDLVERVVASIPLTSLDPHRASVFTRNKGLWRGVGAIAAALGGASGAMRELSRYVSERCGGGAGCRCAGGALLLAAADALAGRGAAGRPLPHHARPSARHLALHTLLSDECGQGGRSPLALLVRHEARAAARLLEQSAREPPFAGPLGRHNRLRVAKDLLHIAAGLQECENRIEILEFIIGQLNTGALPADSELIGEATVIAGECSGEAADRAWLALAARAAPGDTRLAARRASAPPRPRIRWRLDALLGRHTDALTQFFQIDALSKIDIDELFEYLLTKIEPTDEMKNLLECYLPKLIELRPRAAATLMGEYSPECIATLMRSTPTYRSIEFAECLLEMGLLRGDAAAVYFRYLCSLKPDDVKRFLIDNSGVVRPEDAVRIIEEVGPAAALPLCLEAVGDHRGALDSILRLAAAASDDRTKTELVRQAYELCARVTPTVPAATATAMWTRAVREARNAPPELVAEAAAYVPLEALVGGACGSPGAALAMLECAARRCAAWRCAVRVSGREAHEALARALHAARRGVSVREARCAACGGQLSSRAGVRTAVGARALHAGCEPAASPAALPLPPRAPPATHPPAPDHALSPLAPPRPDLEGLA